MMLIWKLGVALPEIVVVLRLLLVMNMMLNWVINVVLIMALEVSFMGRVKVQMRLITLMLVTKMLLFMILHIVMHHVMISVLFLTLIASYLVFRMCGLLNIVFHVVLLFVSDSMSDSQSCNFCRTQAVLLRLTRLLGRGHSSGDLMMLARF